MGRKRIFREKKENQTFFEVLKRKILAESENKENFYEATKEWNIIDREEREKSKCICGKDILVCFRIKNRINGNIYYPIGSDCILRFKNEELVKQIKEFEKVWCEDCKCYIVNKYSIEIHEQSLKHKSSKRKCIEEGCDEKIRIDAPEYMIRCKKCYFSKKNYINLKEIKVN